MPPSRAMPQDAMMRGIAEERAGIQEQAKAQQMQMQQQAKAAEAQMQQQRELQQSFKEQSAGIQAERKALMHDLQNNKIDPKRYENAMSGGQKAATAIGLLLSGAGSGLTGQPNMAMEYLNKQIERDVDAQRQNIHNKQNMLHAFEQQFGNLKDATTMMSVFYADKYKLDIAKAAAQAGTPMAAAQAKMAEGALDQRTGPQLADIARRQAIFQGLESGKLQPEQAVRDMVDEKHQSKAYEELDKIRAIDKGIANVTKAMNEVGDLQSLSNRVFSPAQSKAKIDALNTEISSLAKELYGKVSDNEIGLLEKGLQIGYTDDQETVQKKINTIQKMLEKNRNSSLLQNFRLMPKQDIKLKAKPTR